MLVTARDIQAIDHDFTWPGGGCCCWLYWAAPYAAGYVPWPWNIHQSQARIIGRVSSTCNAIEKNKIQNHREGKTDLHNPEPEILMCLRSSHFLTTLTKWTRATLRQSTFCTWPGDCCCCWWWWLYWAAPYSAVSVPWLFSKNHSQGHSPQSRRMKKKQERVAGKDADLYKLNTAILALASYWLSYSALFDSRGQGSKTKLEDIPKTVIA